ncbi:UbiA prenyltransferase [Diplocarpon rosae]|nr:UbiA prenyltransferase [Diplocarpon rosae]
MDLEYTEEGKLPEQIEERTFLYHLKTAHLITKSDVKTTILPATTFAVTALFSGALSCDAVSDPLTALGGVLKSIAWTWMNLWIFNLSNQRLPNSVLEDAINKPWRAIPSGRLTSEEARRLLMLSIPAVLLATTYLGGSRESLFMMVLTWIYNDLGAAEGHFALRHVNNALGFTTFAAGAASVASGPLRPTTYHWLAFVAAAITYTIQLQDMEDLEGDRARARRTLPLVYGGAVTRRITAASVVVFSLAAPAFWRLSIEGYLPPVALGAWVAVRTLTREDRAADKKTFKLWCLWLMLLYILPFATRLGLVWGGGRVRERYHVKRY